MIRRYFRVGLLAAGCLLTVAETVVPAGIDDHISRYSIDQWNRRDGLPQSGVQSIHQSRDGQLWLGTGQGVARFDGQTFTTFPAEPLAGDYVHVVLEDRRGAIWFGTERGLVCFHNNRFRYFGEESGLPVDRVGTILEKQDGTLLIGTRNSGIYRLSDDTFSPVEIGEDPVLRVRALHESSDGTLWIGTADRGLVRVKDGQISVYGLDEGLGSIFVMSIAEAPAGTLWIGTGEGLDRLAGEEVTSIWSGVDDSPRLVENLYVDDSGSLWMGTMGAGLFRLSLDGEIQELIRGLPSTEIESLAGDREGGLWIGSWAGGLVRLRQGAFRNVTRRQGLSDSFINTVVEDHEGNIWMGTWGYGVNRLGDDGVEAFKSRKGFRGDYIGALHIDRSGTVWVGTWGRGLHHLEDGRVVAHHPVEGLPESYSVWAMADHADQGLWLGTSQGVFHFTENGATPLAEEDPSGRVTALLAQDDTLWIGSSNGLFRHQDGELSRWTAEDGLPSQTVLSIHAVETDLVWVGTSHGLALLHQQQMTAFTTGDGLCDNKVFQILEDDHGFLWLSSDNGISRVRKSDLLARARGSDLTVACTLYTESAGMASRECNGGIQPSGALGHDGRLWFPTIEGVTMIDSSSPPVPREPPAVTLEKTVINGDTLDRDHAGGIPRGRGEVAFHYMAVYLSEPARLRFRYRLEGIDAGWVDAGASRVARYTNVTAGRHTFMVQAGLDDGGWSDQVTRTEVELIPRFHETWSFLFLVLGSVVAVVLLAFLVRVRREQQLSRQVDARTADLLQATERLQEWNRRQSDLISGISHELRTPLTLIRFYTEHLMKYKESTVEQREDDLRIIDRESERLSGLVDRVIEFARMGDKKKVYRLEKASLSEVVAEVLDSFKGYLQSQGFAVETNLNGSATKIRIDVGAVGLAFGNLLDNAMKYSPKDRRIHVEIIENDDMVGVEVRDHGIGIPPEETQRIFEAFYRAKETAGTGGYGLGLYMVEEIMRVHGGRVMVESRQGSGSGFRLVFPRGDRT